MSLQMDSLIYLSMQLLPVVLLIAALLSFYRYWQLRRGNRDRDIDRINALLPQTQCGYCSYPGCRPYAEAILEGEAINKCPPGGAETIARLASLLDEAGQSLHPAHGAFRNLRSAVIREEECIGCTKCIQACPVDAILGSGKLMHTVITAECNGCDLCLAPCPVDCIDMIEVQPRQLLKLRAVSQ